MLRMSQIWRPLCSARVVRQNLWHYRKYTIPSPDGPPAVDIDAYKAAMRGLAAPVAIITCCDKEGNRAGMTVSSVASVEIDPNPVLSFNLHVPSRTSRILKAAGGICGVSLLHPSDQNLALAVEFSGLKGNINPFELHPDAFVEWHGCPVLRETGAALLCRVEQMVPVKNHIIAIAGVVHVQLGSCSGLLYQYGQFLRPGEPC